MAGSCTDVLATVLRDCGTRLVFGVPGTQNTGTFESLRSKGIRTVLPTHELAGAFMAIGHARASGAPGVLVTIPGPGFMYALTGIAEARLDSTPLLHILEGPSSGKHGRFGHQAIPMREVAASLVKGFIEVDDPLDVEESVRNALDLAARGEPGPVILHVTDAAGSEQAGAGASLQSESDRESPATSDSGQAELLESAAASLTSARRPVIFLGLGASSSVDPVGELAGLLGAPVFSTPSARGLLPEDDPLSLRFDFARGGLEVLNELLAESDLVMALGCRLGHNGTGGFKLRLSESQLMHVNSDGHALGATYPARFAIRQRVESFVPWALDHLRAHPPASVWRPEDVAGWRSRIRASVAAAAPLEPRLSGRDGPDVGRFITAMREVLPRDAIVVTDSGLHQTAVRRHFEVLAPQGLIFPSDFQSMGFGIPAAIGAKLARPERTVVAVIGDGGLCMSGLELLTAVREELGLAVVVFNDGFLNLIRIQQLEDFGQSTAVRLKVPDMEGLATAVGADFLRVDAVGGVSLEPLAAPVRPMLIEVPLTDSKAMSAMARRGRAKAVVRGALGERLIRRSRAFLKWVGDRLS